MNTVETVMQKTYVTLPAFMGGVSRITGGRKSVRAIRVCFLLSRTLSLMVLTRCG